MAGAPFRGALGRCKDPTHVDRGRPAQANSPLRGAQEARRPPGAVRRLGDARAVHGHRRRAPARCAPRPGSSTSRTWASSSIERRARRGRWSTTWSPNDAARLADGQALYTCALQRAGHDPRRPHRLPRRARRACSSSATPATATRSRRTSSKAAENHCEFDDAPTRRALIALAGPEGAVEILALAGGDAAALRRAQELPLPRRGRRQRDAAPSRAPATPAKTASRSSARSSDAPQLWRTLLELGRAARHRAGRPRRARHAAPRGAARALRQRHRRDDQPARGRPRLGREARQGRCSSARTRSSRVKAEGPGAQAGRLRDDRARHRAPRLSAARRGGRARSASARAEARRPRSARTSASATCRAAHDRGRHRASWSTAAARAVEARRREDAVLQAQPRQRA